MKTGVIIFLVLIVVLLAWALRLLRIEIKKFEEEYFMLQKSNKELLEANINLINKIRNEINQN